MKRVLIWIYVIFVEVFAIFLCMIFFPFRSKKIDHFEPQRKDKPDVLCVHGYMHNETPWMFFRKYLQRQGAGPVHTVFYPSMKQDIIVNSLRIRDRIQEIQKETDREVNVLIGHSLGGLECLEYALEHAPKDKILYIITMGTPFQGSKVATLGFGRSVVQMRINSEYIQSLHQRLPKANHIRLLTIGSKTDTLIFPRSSALLTNLHYSQAEQIDILGHVSMLFSKRILKRIVAFLKREKVIIKDKVFQ